MFFGRPLKIQALAAFCLLGLGIGFLGDLKTIAKPNFYVRKKLLPTLSSEVTSEAPAVSQPEQEIPRQVIPGLPPKAPGKPLKPPPEVLAPKVDLKPVSKQPTVVKASIKTQGQPKPKVQGPLRIDMESNAVKPSPNPVPIKAAAKRTTSEPVKINPKTKPLVHFPEDLVGDGARNSNSKNYPTNSALYPKRYKPLLPPINVHQADWHEQAVSAYELGNSLGQQDRIDEAMAAYQKAIKMSPNFADAYIGLSTAAILKGQWETALNSANKGLSLKNGFTDPSNITRAYYNLSATYCVMDHYSQAKRYYHRVQKAHYPLAPQLWSYIQNNCKH